MAGNSDSRNAIYRLQESANRSDLFVTFIALLLTLLIHVLIFLCVPDSFVIEEKKPEELTLTIIPPQLRRSIPKFMEANPYANEQAPISKDVPDSYKNQRAADEITDSKSKSKLPYVEGESKSAQKIVSGTSDKSDTDPSKVFETLQRPLLPPESLENPPSKTVSNSNNTDAELSNESKSSNKEGKTEDNSDREISQGNHLKEQIRKGTNVSDELILDTKAVSASSGSQKSDSKLENKKQGKSKKITESTPKKNINEMTQEKPMQVSKVSDEIPHDKSLPAPRKRLSLSMKIPAGPLVDNRTRASQMGTLAVDTRFSEFGAYTQRMVEAVSRQWNLIGREYDLSTAFGTMVVIEFYLNTKGELTKIKTEFSTSTNTGTGLCEQAILTTAPYGEWTEEMILTLGSQDVPVRFRFYYR